ncbi:MAG: transposase [Betaproteobacteria bacterium]
MGETEGAVMATVDGAVDTLGGRVQVRFDPGASVTPLGQMACFAEHLQTTGLFAGWERDCPLRYTSPNGSALRDILGTWLLSGLCGHQRYAHVTALRGDAVSAQVLGCERIVSEDTLRRALKAMDAKAAERWLQTHLLRSVRPALSTASVLDVDSSIKPLCGRQAGSVVSFNPHKPGRPSHVLHTYWAGQLRLVLDVELAPGDAHAAQHALPGLLRLLDGFEPHEHPALVRGDCGFGDEPVIGQLEERGLSYLFKLRQSGWVKKLLHGAFADDEQWSAPGPSDQGWSAKQTRLRLSTWPAHRRVIVLRRAVRQALAVQIRDAQGRPRLRLTAGDDGQFWEYAVPVTNTAHEPRAIAQLYRDRADAENAFDELKNQWGWGATAQRTSSAAARPRAGWRCSTTVGVGTAGRPNRGRAWRRSPRARCYWRRWVGACSTPDRACLLYVSPMHGAVEQPKTLLVNIRTALAHVRKTAEQLDPLRRWQAFVSYVVHRITRPLAPPTPRTPALAGP